MMYENRNYTIFSVTELDSIDFNHAEILKTLSTEEWASPNMDMM